MRFLLLFLTALGLCVAAAHAQQEHEHLNAGISGTLAPGSKLAFDDVDFFLAESGFVWETTYQPDNYFPGYYATTNITFTALAATVFYGGPDGPHAHASANLKLQIVAVNGPAGGSFGYWEGGSFFTETTPTASFNVGSTTPVSSTDNSLSAFSGGYWTLNLTTAAPADPFGHVHDRGYSFTLPGNYDIGFRIIDTTGYHTMSDTYTLRFGVVPEPSSALLLLSGSALAGGLRLRRKGRA